MTRLVAAAPAAAVLCDSPSFSLCGPADDPCVIARNKPCDVTAASPIKTFDLGSRTLVVKAGATLRVSPLNPDTDPAGGMIIRARSVRLEPGGAITAPGYLRTLADATVVGVGGSVTIRTTGDIVIDVQPDGSKRSSIDVSARTNAGVIDLGAGGSILIGGILRSHANTQAGMGGRILLAGRERRRDGRRQHRGYPRNERHTGIDRRVESVFRGHDHPHDQPGWRHLA